MMEIISIFDMLKVGIGPSSSHTLGPWKAAKQFIAEVLPSFDEIDHIKVNLYGSLSLTGKGHATDIAVVMGLSGAIPEEIDPQIIPLTIQKVKSTQTIFLNGQRKINFSFSEDIVFNKSFLAFHANALTFTASGKNVLLTKTYYSIGGGFVIKDNESLEESHSRFIPFPIQNGMDLMKFCQYKKVSEVVLINEKSLHSEEFIDKQLENIWFTMIGSVQKGCTKEGKLPGGLNVKRRATDLYKSLGGPPVSSNFDNWLSNLRNLEIKFGQTLKWVSCFAMAVNEVNADMGRIVTAPTNGSAGVIPAVLMYYLMVENKEGGLDEIKRFLLVAGEIGSIFKKGATISAAMGGCQAEIGVSSAMAAAALCELIGGTPEQVLVAAEIAMEHHLGLTCDPIGGLVQIPCIERNSMGALKAIAAAQLAIETNPTEMKVPLDKIVATMWQTAQDMNIKYKETSTGGLAIAVNMADC
jgi:L-serine dehydratase